MFTGNPLYTPLDQSNKEIRLLRVAPYNGGYHSDEVLSVCECTMFTASLSQQSPVKYNAFSYEWGYTKEIDVNYHDDDVVVVNGHRVQVTKNLVALLTRYRNIAMAAPNWQATHIPIWIDALCIDQGNSEERNSQVALMGAIYTGAQATLSWFGESEDDSDYAMEIIADVGSKLLNMPKEDDDLAWVDPVKQPELWKGSGFMNRFWTSLGAIMKRTYWQRAWIVQEVLLQPNVIIFCGKNICHYFQLEAIHRWVRRIQGRPCPPGVDADLWQLLSTKVGWYAIGFNNLHSRIRVNRCEHIEGLTLDEEGHQHLSWRTWITNTLYKQATDPRDNLYSVLGLVGIDALRPDYSSSPERVFYDFATTNIRIERSLDILTHAGHFELPPATETGHRPPATNLFVLSWVPNWDQISKTYSFTWSFRASDRADKDWSSIQPPKEGQIPWSVQGNTLVTPGVLFDVVTESRICDTDDGSWLSFCLDYVDSQSGRLYPTGIPVLQALARLALRGRGFSGEPLESHLDTETLLTDVLPGFFLTFSSNNSVDSAKDAKQTQETFGLASPEGVIKNFFGEAQARAHSTEQKSPEGVSRTAEARANFLGDSMNFRSEFTDGIRQHAACVTAKRYIGWARKGLHKGDHIVILPECRMPVVLRKVDSHYIHVGTCHVQGLMQGEAITCVREGTAQVETFHIM